MALLQYSDPDVVQRCDDLRAIGAMDEQEAMGRLFELESALSDRSVDVRCAAMDALGQLGALAADIVPAIVVFFKDPDAEVRRSAVDAVGLLDEHSAEPGASVHKAAALLADPVPGVRASAALALGRMEAVSYGPDVRSCLADSEPDVVSSALGAIGMWGASSEDMLPSVVECLSHRERGVRALAVGTLLKLGGKGEEQASEVVGLLADREGMVREAAVKYFEVLGDRGASEAERMAEILGQEDERFQAAAALALGFAKAEKSAPAVAKLLKSRYEDDTAAAQCAAGADKALPATLRRPCCAAAMALGLMGGKAGWGYANEVADLLGDNAPVEVAATLLHALGLMGNYGLAYDDTVADMCKHAAGPVRASACFALGEFAKIEEDYDRAEVVAARLQDTHAAVRQAAAEALGKMPEEGPRRAEAVFPLLTDRVACVQIAAMEAMAAFGDVGQMFAPEICKLITADDMDVRLKAIEVLGEMGDRGAAMADDMAPLLEDESPYIREEVLKAFAKMGEEAAQHLPTISALMQDPSAAVREAAEQCHDALV